MIKPAREFVIATRKSPLAMAQTHLAKELFERGMPEAIFRIEKMVTTGDKRQEWSLEKAGGKGLFTKELEDALLEGRADFAVHSAKDLPSEMPGGLSLAGFLPRQTCEDVLILREGVEIPRLIATGSPRRRIQLRYLFPKAEFTEIRGNVDTRLNKIARGDADATVLASAGLNRLGIESWEGVTFRKLTLDECVPAVGQAAVAIQCRAEDVDTFASYLDLETAIAVNLERAFLRELGGGCQVAFAVNYVAGKLRIYHKQCGKELRDLPEEYVATHYHKIATKLIEQLELKDA
ncbi:hydroxymethylbilane synthase [Pelagicoccus sp. SDUM812002]|uniref:hydroxymethylbilane synthase n=1 Tax=Pelagicoccus sp. SDUM812002 TaxID=3041266 RepID=UPI00280D0411|nr:hydroxymethylbilane synthase [Pelagicoccus sp. SDUM812002]MDQ8186716.1 hydroxymethylbilane synthase [Pelagicoccus sp. SDUM812002]